MTDNDDYSDVLDGTVDEAKDAIQDLEDPSYDRLLELEREGKDRKTLKQWIEERRDDGVSPAKNTGDSGGIFSGLSASSAILAGGFLGLLVGIVAGAMVAGGSSAAASPAEVEQTVVNYVEASGFNGTVSATSRREHSLYYINLTLNQNTVNGTETRSQGVYVTLDGELLIPIRRNPLTGQMMSPINLQRSLQRLQQRNQAPTPPENSTGAGQ